MPHLTIRGLLSSVFVVVISAILLRDVQAQGLALGGVGAVNRSFGSAAVAAPIDASGAINYNPATLSAIKAQSQLGLELLWADTKASSSIDAMGISGSTDDTSGINPIPAFALVQKPESCKEITFGLGFFGTAGYRSDYPSSTTNPVLTPQPPLGAGLGNLHASAEFFEIIPALAYQITDEFSVGFAPRLSIAKVEISPMVFAPPSSIGAYPNGSDPNYRYGGGFEAGAYYAGQRGVNLGASFKSTQWLQSFSANTTDEFGNSRSVSFDMDYPMIVSIGASYTGIPDWIFATDVRYFNYGNTAGFEDSGYAADGSVRGLGWDSIWAVGTGIQYTALPGLSFRLGYLYNENPISDSETMFNIASPLVTQHLLGVGASYEIWNKTYLSLAWLHGFENSISGPIEKPGIGEIPTSSVKAEMSAEAIAVQLTMLH